MVRRLVVGASTRRSARNRGGITATRSVARTRAAMFSASAARDPWSPRSNGSTTIETTETQYASLLAFWTSQSRHEAKASCSTTLGGWVTRQTGRGVFISLNGGYQDACGSAAATAIEVPCVLPPVGYGFGRHVEGRWRRTLIMAFTFVKASGRVVKVVDASGPLSNEAHDLDTRTARVLGILPCARG